MLDLIACFLYKQSLLVILQLHKLTLLCKNRIFLHKMRKYSRKWLRPSGPKVLQFSGKNLESLNEYVLRKKIS